MYIGCWDFGAAADDCIVCQFVDWILGPGGGLSWRYISKQHGEVHVGTPTSNDSMQIDWPGSAKEVDAESETQKKSEIDHQKNMEIYNPSKNNREKKLV